MLSFVLSVSLYLLGDMFVSSFLLASGDSLRRARAVAVAAHGITSVPEERRWSSDVAHTKGGPTMRRPQRSRVRSDTSVGNPNLKPPMVKVLARHRREGSRTRPTSHPRKLSSTKPTAPRVTATYRTPRIVLLDEGNSGDFTSTNSSWSPLFLLAWLGQLADSARNRAYGPQKEGPT